jgi:hypothetical protein
MISPPVALNTNTSYAHIGRLDLFYQSNGACSFFWVLNVIIVIKQFCTRRGLLCKPEGFHNIILTQQLQKDGIASVYAAYYV